MLDVILVDDEPAVLRRLQTIVPWESLGWRIAATAADGEDGLAAVTAHSPDLVITDIRMPVLDGMELARRAVELDDPPEFIFLTGYGEFDLVRHALRLGVVDYLLKPVDAEKLKEALELVKERRFANVGRDSAADWAHRAIAGELKPAERAPFDLAEYSVVALHVRYTSEDGPRAVRTGDYRLICARSGALDADYLLPIREVDRASIRFVADRLIDAAVPVAGVVGVGNAAHAPAHIERSAAEARRAADEAYYEGTGCPLFASDLRASPEPDASDAVLDARTRLVSLIRTMDGAGVQTVIDDLRSELLRRRPNPTDLQQRLSDLATALRLQFAGAPRSTTRPAAAICTLDDTLDALRVEALDLIGLLGAKWGARTEPVSEWVRRYLRAHYSDGITLKKLADLAHLNPVYLGHRFRAETGCSFQSELLATRMRVAAEALLGSDAPIHVISRQVGYTAPVNFYRGFKRIHGMSPAQFRATHKKEKQ